MKKIFYLLVILAGIGLYYYLISFDDNTISRNSSPCNKPLSYKIGSVNSLYNISEQELKRMLEKINDTWSAPLEKDLFTYSKDGDIAINLIYGKQQRTHSKEESASSRINLKKISYENKEKELKRLKSIYSRKKEAYDKLVTEYKHSKTDSNFKYKAGQKREGIKQEEAELNRLANTINEKISEINRISAEIASLIEEYNKEYGSSGKFNQGNYRKTASGATINIYSFKSLAELKLILAHEMGHALGINHVKNSKSVMYYLMEDQQVDNLRLTSEDISALRSKCETNQPN